MKEIVNLIYEAMDEVNQMLPPEQHLRKSADMYLHGSSGKIDSLALINLIVAIEQKIEEKFGVSVTLANESPRPGETGFFETVHTLSIHLSTLLDEKAHDKELI